MQTILIVQDETLKLRLEASFMERRSLRILLATDESALDMAREHVPDVIMLSVPQADEEAFTVCQGLRPSLDATTPYVVMVTAEPPPANMVPPANMSVVERGRMVEAVAHALAARMRAAPRVLVQIMARVDTLQGEGRPMMFANILDLSESGLRLECSEALAMGSRVRVYFVLPGSSERIGTTCLVRVLHDKDQLHYGLSFDGLDDSSRRAIGQLVEKRLAR
ncbi:MAG: PilZ domain-containing protein [Myxococcota bacterium]